MTDAAVLPAPPADPDRRFYAFVVDRLVAWSIDAAVAYLAYRYLIDAGHPIVGVLAIVGTVLLGGAGFAVALGLTGSSPGRAATRTRLLAIDGGAPIGVGAALRRQLLLGLATLPTFGLGAATLAWTAVADPGGRRRGWHDRIAGSEAVDVRRAPFEPPAEEAGPRHVVNLTALRLVPAPAAPPPSGPPPPVSSAARPTPPPPATPLPGTSLSAGPPPTTPPAPAGPPPLPPTGPPQRQRLGHPLVPEPDGPSTPLPDLSPALSPTPPARWRIGFDSGETLVLDGPALVGRRPEPRSGEPVAHLLALRSEDMSLSKTHAQLHVDAAGVLVVIDRGSTNGSILLRQGAARELPAGRATTLLDGDVVRFGDREMRVGLEAGTAGSVTVR